MNTASDKPTEKNFKRFANMKLIFNKDLVHATGLIKKRLFVKCGETRWQCLLHTVTPSSATVIARMIGNFIIQPDTNSQESSTESRDGN